MKIRLGKSLKNRNYLELTPVRMVKHELFLNGRVMLLVPRFKKKWLYTLFVPKRKGKEYRVKLDELGSKVWLAIDGEKNVETICQQVCLNLPDKPDNFEQRVTGFLTMLFDRDFISFKEQNQPKK